MSKTEVKLGSAAALVDLLSDAEIFSSMTSFSVSLGVSVISTLDSGIFGSLM